MNTDVVTVTTRVPLDPARAFQLFVEDVDDWWCRGPRPRFLPDPGGTLRFEPGANGRLIEEGSAGRHVVGRIRAWEPGRRLAFAFRPRGAGASLETEVEVRFEAEGRATRVTLVHRGLDRIPVDHPLRGGADPEAHANQRSAQWLELLAALGYRARAG